MTKKVLIVEDNALNMRLFTDVLTMTGLEVVQVMDGHVAVAEITSHKPDLVLMDIHIDDVSGLDVTREVRQNPELTMPIIAVTAFTSEEDKKAIAESGCTGYIPKPIDITDFVTKVHAALA